MDAGIFTSRLLIRVFQRKGVPNAEFCKKVLAISPGLGYHGGMQMEGWNTVQIGREERPTVTRQDLLAMVQELDPDDYDEAVQQFLEEVERGEDPEMLKRAATLLLQDEVDLAPEFKEMEVEPDEKLIAVLLALGADPDAPNAYGEPPLHLAARHGYAKIAEMLLIAGADVQRHNSRGQRPVELAVSEELKEMLSPRAGH